MPIFSLESDYGIGTLGRASYEFVDFLDKAGQTYWQVLPINPISIGNSPYLTVSSSSGNPLFIDLDILCDEGLLKKEDYSYIDFGTNPERVDYEKLLSKDSIEAIIHKMAGTVVARYNLQSLNYMKTEKKDGKFVITMPAASVASVVWEE